MLGRPKVKALKFDLRQNLEILLDEVHKTHMSDFRNKAEKLSVSTYWVISYQSEDDDPIPPTETIVTGFGKEPESEIKNPADKILYSAREN